jgi:hypothetical protein
MPYPGHRSAPGYGAGGVRAHTGRGPDLERELPGPRLLSPQRLQVPRAGGREGGGRGATARRHTTDGRAGGRAAQQIACEGRARGRDAPALELPERELLALEPDQPHPVRDPRAGRRRVQLHLPWDTLKDIEGGFLRVLHCSPCVPRRTPVTHSPSSTVKPPVPPSATSSNSRVGGSCAAPVCT